MTPTSYRGQIQINPPHHPPPPPTRPTPQLQMQAEKYKIQYYVYMGNIHTCCLAVRAPPLLPRGLHLATRLAAAG